MGHQYDAGGNRTLKVDALNHRQVEYHYDLESPGLYGSKANRLMWYETWNTTIPTFPQLVSTTYYVYTYDSTDPRHDRTDDNPTRIITGVRDSRLFVTAELLRLSSVVR